MVPRAWQGPTSDANNELRSDHLWAQDSLLVAMWGTCQGKEEGMGERAEWSEIDAAGLRKLTARGYWDLEIICCLSVKTRCEAILDCCSCSPICHGPEWKWLVVQCASVHVCLSIYLYLHAGNALLHAKIKFTHAERLARKLRGQTHAGTSCLQVDFTGDNEDLWLIRLYF